MAEFDLLAMLGGEPGTLRTASEQSRRPVYGLTLGVVTDVDDPEMLGRVKVRLPWISDVVESAWARVVVPWAGGTRGSYFPPEVDDDVAVTFRHGDLRQPYVLGMLWSESRRPPQTSPRLERRGLKSKTGHELRFDDTPGAGSSRLVSGAGHELVLDDTSGTATARLTASGGQMEVKLDTTSNTVTISSTSGSIELKAPAGKVTVQAAGFDVNATGPVQIQSSATVAVKGSVVTLN
jgi:uncharacterized protein involved in type VI secretion and phage assembly